MNIFGLGPGELMLIAVLGLIVFGPGRLPEIAAQLGKAVRDLRQSSADIRSEFQRSFAVDLQLDDLKLDQAFKGQAAALPGASTAVASESAPPASPEPAPADSGAWRWEGSESVSIAPPVPVPPDVAYWEWDDTRSALWASGELLHQTTEWQWDDAPPASNGRANGLAQSGPLEEHPHPAALAAEPPSSAAQPDEPAPISTAGPGSV
jgi:TatA/E family protein of Tat protein translocase